MGERFREVVHLSGDAIQQPAVSGTENFGTLWLEVYLLLSNVGGYINEGASKLLGIACLGNFSVNWVCKNFGLVPIDP